MDPKPAEPIPYATPARKGGSTVLTAATVDWRTAAGAAWLAGVLAILAWVAGQFFGQQQATASATFRLSLTDLMTSAPWAFLAYTAAGPAAFSVAVGAVAAAVFYNWSVPRLTWFAALPATAGCWSAATAVTPDTGLYAGPLATVGGIVIAQAGLTYAGTRIGRPLARWLARHLVPPPLRASLIALWV